MSDKTDTGGPAFACAAADGVDYHIEDGMTLLDYFAGQALPAIIEQLANTKQANERMVAEGLVEGEFDKLCALCAYDYAEAMIAEKRKRKAK